MDNFPLIELFTRLREAGLPLGINDYQAVLKAMQAGWGLENQAALARLCRTLWVKSKQEQKIFDYYFEQIIIYPNKPVNNSQIVARYPLSSEQESLENSQVESPKAFRFFSYFILLLSYLVPVSISLFFYLGILRIITSNKVPIFTSRPTTSVIKDKSYQYKITTLDVDKNDKLMIKLESCSSWLTFKDYKDGTAILYGTEGKAVRNCLDEQLAELTDLFKNQPKNQPKTYSVELLVIDNHGARSKQSFTINVVDKISGKEMSIWFLLLGWLIFLAILYAPLRKKKNTKTIDEQKSSSSGEEQAISDDNSLETLSKASDDIKVAESQQKASQAEKVKPLNRFIQIIEYPPVTRRQMKQSWRYLRRIVRQGVPTELDVEATIERISRQGVLLEPVIVPRRINRTKLLLMIDQDGSMIPFKNLSHQLTETAVQGGRLEKTDIYYFHNCPMDYLYQDPYYQMAKKIEDVFTSLNSSYTAMLVFSDAGAARSSFNPERLEVTAQFLEQVKQQIRYIAWLNPMPRYRWFGTTANKIAQLVPMFELSRQGLHNAIGVLRGQSGYFGKSKL